MRACRLDCLRGLGFGVASGSWVSARSKTTAVPLGESIVDNVLLDVGFTLLSETTPGRLRFELTDAGRVIDAGPAIRVLGVNGPDEVIELCL